MSSLAKGIFYQPLDLVAGTDSRKSMLYQHYRRTFPRLVSFAVPILVIGPKNLRFPESQVGRSALERPFRHPDDLRKESGLLAPQIDAELVLSQAEQVSYSVLTYSRAYEVACYRSKRWLLYLRML